MRFTNHLRNIVKNIQRVLNSDQNIVSVDKYRISVKAGAGGAGISRYNGVGGDGGSVYLVGKQGIPFSSIPKSLGGRLTAKADPGTPSQKTKLIGDRGRDLYIAVPVGVEAIDEERNILLGRCTRLFDRILIASGGEGGKASNGYKGQRGDNLMVTLHLKLRPNVGLVGFPNAGKSTLLQAFVPKKSVRIAPYPFTTVKPQIGFWSPTTSEMDSPFTLSIADLPGLVEGASRNRGKGYQFLKHLEYCDVLLMVVDINGFVLANTLSEPFRSAIESVALLNMELENYDRRLTSKPAILVLNKIDIAKDMEETLKLRDLLIRDDWPLTLPRELRPFCPLHFDYVLPISAKRGDIDEVKAALARLHRDIRPKEVPEDLIPRNDR